MMRARAALFMTTSFRTRPAATLFAVPPMLGVEHDAAVDLVFAGEDRFEGREHFLDAKIGQIAQAAVVDAEHENVGVADQPGGRDHRAVAAEDDDQVRSRDLAAGSTGSPASSTAVGLGTSQTAPPPSPGPRRGWVLRRSRLFLSGLRHITRLPIINEITRNCKALWDRCTTVEIRWLFSLFLLESQFVPAGHNTQ